MDFYGISVIDIGASLVVCLCVLRGFHRGLSGEFGQLISLILALFLGLYFFHPFGSWIESHARLSPQTAHAMGFVVIVVTVILAMVILSLLLRSVLKIVFEPGVDKPGGGLAGLLSGLTIVAIIFLVMNFFPHDYLNRKFGQESVVGKLVVRWMPQVQEKVESLPVSETLQEGIEKAQEL